MERMNTTWCSLVPLGDRERHWENSTPVLCTPWHYASHRVLVDHFPFPSYQMLAPPRDEDARVLLLEGFEDTKLTELIQYFVQ